MLKIWFVIVLRQKRAICSQLKQKAIKPDVDAKSIRLDVYVQDDRGTIYDIEMQVTDTKELPKRTRYYQSVIDLQLIDKGRHIYTFENICKEDTNIAPGDGAVKIFLNADSEMNDVSKELAAFLDYVAGKETDDSFVKKLDDAVKNAKKNREWRHEYMTLLMRDQENLERGIEKGIEKGTLQERRKIIIKMIGQGFNDVQIMSVCETSAEEISECRKSMQCM